MSILHMFGWSPLLGLITFVLSLLLLLNMDRASFNNKTGSSKMMFELLCCALVFELNIIGLILCIIVYKKKLSI